MYVILHNNDISTREFLGFLEQKAKKNTYIAITIKELIREVKIIDKLYEKTNDCTWSLFNENIHYNGVSGFLNRIQWIDISLFDDYIEEDQSYVQSEWWAYLVYRVNNTKNAMNSYTREILSGQFFQFPFQFEVCQKVGIKTPKYLVSNDSTELKDFSEGHLFTARNSLYDNFDFRRNSEIKEDTTALIEFTEGDTVIIHLINKKIFATHLSKNGKAKTTLPESFCEKLIELSRHLNLKSLEIMVKVTPSNDYIAQYLSAFPNYTYCDEVEKSTLYSELHKALRT